MPQRPTWHRGLTGGFNSSNTIGLPFWARKGRPDRQIRSRANRPLTRHIRTAMTSKGILPAVTTTTILNDTAQDSPALNLISTWGEEERWFQATMYLMWVPATDPNCNNGAFCTVPVPQGKVEWWFAGDAINTRQPIVNQGVSSVQWLRNGCSGGGTQPYQPGTLYPQWATAINP